MHLFDQDPAMAEWPEIFDDHERFPLFDECALRRAEIPPAAAYGEIVCRLVAIYEADATPPKDPKKAEAAADARHERARAAVADVTTALSHAGFHIAPSPKPRPPEPRPVPLAAPSG